MKKYFSFPARTALLLLCAGLLSWTTPAAAQNGTAAARPAGFEEMAEKLVPAVVNVSATVRMEAPEKGELPPMPELPPGSPFEEFFKDFYDQYQNGKPQTDEKGSSLGSGFVVDAANGYIVTNNHVIKDADEIKVVLNDNTSLDAELVGTDEKTDLAVLKVKTDRPLTAAVWGDSDKARVGSWVLAIGNPFGLGGTVTAGIVSARHRDINTGPYDEFIQTDASINRGNSGGPMFDMNGQVIGVNTAIFTPSGGSVGIGFAVPSNMARGVVEQLIKYGKTKRGWLGVRIQEVTPEIAESLGLDKPKGALVSGVTPKGPAEKAGIRTGDIILKFGGKAIDQMRQLPKIVADTEVGQKAEITLWRKGKEVIASVDLGQLEKAEESGMIASSKEGKKTEIPSTAVESAGFSLAPLTDQLREAYKIPDGTKGVLITKVKGNSPAADKGLGEGDVITEVDQQEVSTPQQVADRIAAAEKAGRSSVLLFISRDNDMRFVALKLKKK